MWDVNGLRSRLIPWLGCICWVALTFMFVRFNYPIFAKPADRSGEKILLMFEGIAFDEGAMLLLRGKLCRVNPMSAKGMK